MLISSAFNPVAVGKHGLHLLLMYQLHQDQDKKLPSLVDFHVNCGLSSLPVSIALTSTVLVLPSPSNDCITAFVFVNDFLCQNWDHPFLLISNPIYYFQML